MWILKGSHLRKQIPNWPYLSLKVQEFSNATISELAEEEAIVFRQVKSRMTCLFVGFVYNIQLKLLYWY